MTSRELLDAIVDWLVLSYQRDRDRALLAVTRWAATFDDETRLYERDHTQWAALIQRQRWLWVVHGRSYGGRRGTLPIMDEHFVNAVIEGGTPAKAVVTAQRDAKDSDGNAETVVDLWVFPTNQTGAGRVLTDVPLLDKPGDNGEPPARIGNRPNYAYPWVGGTSSTAKTLKR